MADCIHVGLGRHESPDGGFLLSFLDTYFIPVDVVLAVQDRLDRDQLLQTLEDTLSLYPPVYGRFRPPSSAT
jgi:hypothetical protein